MGYKNIDQHCPLCSTDIETVDHLFFKCCKTTEVWREIKNWVGLRKAITTIPSAIKWIIKERSREKIIRKARNLALMTMISLIMWRACNVVVHNQKTFEPKYIVFEVKKVTYATLYSMYPHDTVEKYLGV